MKIIKLRRFALVMAVCVIVNGMAVAGVYAGEEYSFSVFNSTDYRITQILVSENKRSWGRFKIGSGIKPGETVTLLWDESTNNQNCEQYVKAVFDDGVVSEPSKFDFCEKGLEIYY